MSAPRIAIEDQIVAVRQSALCADAASKKAGDEASTRAAALYAALRTLCFCRDHREAIADVMARRATGEAATAESERRRFSDLPLGQQAALRCNEGAFQKFMRASNADGAAGAVRARCGVASRAEFDSDAAAGDRWRALDGDYRAWLDCRGGE